MAKIMSMSLSCHPCPIFWLVFLVQSPGSYFLVSAQHITTHSPLLNGSSSSMEVWPVPPQPPLIKSRSATGPIRTLFFCEILRKILSLWEIETLIFELRSSECPFYIYLVDKVVPCETIRRKGSWRQVRKFLTPFPFLLQSSEAWSHSCPGLCESSLYLYDISPHFFFFFLLEQVWDFLLLLLMERTVTSSHLLSQYFIWHHHHSKEQIKSWWEKHVNK